MGYTSHIHFHFHNHSFNNITNIIIALVPFINVIKSYDKNQFIGDIQAGITIAFVLLPSSIAYASLAGVPPISGLLSAIFPPILYALFGIGGQISVGPEALTSVMIGLITHNYPSSDAAQVASSIGFTCGILSLLLALLQAGFIQNILSGYLLTGFVLGVSNLVMVEQLPNLLGLPPVSGLESQSTIHKLIAYINVFPYANINTFLLSLTCVFILAFNLYLKNRFTKKFSFIASIPDILFIVILCITLSYSFDFKNRGIATLGLFSNKIPIPHFPSLLTWEFMTTNLTLAITITLVGFYESQTVIREFGRKFNYFPSGDRTLFSFGIVNLVNSLLGGYAAFGSLPRSKIQATSAKTSMASLITGLVVLLVTVSLHDVIQYLPKSALASIVFVAAYRLIEWKQIAYILKMKNTGEISKFLATWLFTIGFGVSTGIVLCLVLSIIVIVRRSTALDAVVLGELVTSKNVKKFVDIQVHPEAHVRDGLLILSIRGTLQFFNASKLSRRVEMLTDAVESMISGEKSIPFSSSIPTNTIPNLSKPTLSQYDPQNEPVQNFSFISSKSNHHFDLVLDFSEMHELDSSGIWTILELVENAKQQKKYKIYLIGLQSVHQKMMELAGVVDVIGRDRVFKNAVELVESISI